MVKLAPLYYNIITTGWGQVAAVWSDAGLWELSFPRPESQAALADIKTSGIIGLRDDHIANLWVSELTRELNLYFRGIPVAFEVPIDWQHYTSFQTAALRYTAAIPYGATVSYQAVAEAVGSPKAARAVGGAMHSNRTPLVVPCHRVVGSGGSLTGFGGGLELKRALLLMEQQQ